MFQTGSQINPALGRVDYTPYMQGAVAGAQSIGQGIASLGQSIGSGMEAYAKRKKENKMMEASLKANINSLEGLSKIASSLSPQAQEQFNSTMQQLNDPSIPLTEKVALSEAAQKTVGELINFGMQEKQKQEQATIQQLGYESAISGQPIPLVYPQSVRAPAAIQSLAIQGQLANIAETKAKAKAAGVQDPTEIIFENPALAESYGKSMLPPDSKLMPVPVSRKGGFGVSFQPKPTATFASPEEEAAKEASKGLIGRINKQTEEESAYAANAQQTIEEIATTRQALAEGAMVGAGQNAIDSLIGVFSRIPGAGDYFEKLKGNQDVLKRSVSSFAIDSAQRIAGQGQITDSERKLVASTVPQNTDSRVGFEFGLGFLQATVERRQKYAALLEDTQARLSSGQLTPAEAARITNKTKFYKDNPIDVKGIYEMAKNPKKPAPAPAGGGINLSPAALQFIPR